MDVIQPINYSTPNKDGTVVYTTDFGSGFIYYVNGYYISDGSLETSKRYNSLAEIKEALLDIYKEFLHKKVEDARHARFILDTIKGNI